jgi:hypothetical protein
MRFPLFGIGAFLHRCIPAFLHSCILALHVACSMIASGAGHFPKPGLVERLARR